ncbi:MAG: single-stranded-DNA-specific exonuclease RecJ [Candidatus Aminicenantales bacterium]
MNDAIWYVPPPRPEAEILSAGLGIPRELAQVLVNRNILDVAAAQKFLCGSVDDLHDPYLMSGMAEAVARIRKAIETGEKILIFGDYDADGVLSVVMLHKALATLGAGVDYFIPERLKDGYGIKDHHVAIPEERGASLVISVDCGIKAVGFVAAARAKGIDVIITDHHRPGDVLPDALAILNPMVGGSGYPDQGLAGVGVVFKLIQALLEGAGKRASLPHYMKLVCIGTVADVAEIKGENRIFVRYGLKGLENVSNAGLKSLLDSCGLGNKKVSEGDLGFRIGPRINAAGRMGMTDLAVQLFFSDSALESADLVKRLEELNSRRQKTEEKIFNQALSRIEERSLADRYRCLVLGSEDWHRGVIGIVASKLKDHFHRPVILFSYDDGKAYGSGRSIGDFPLIELIEGCGKHFLSYGGHRLAVGCTLRIDEMPAFKATINELAALRISDADLKKKVRIDTALGLGSIDAEFLRQYGRLVPFGVGNPKPVFLAEKIEVASEPKKLQGKHLKFWVKENGRTFEALAWNKADWAGAFGSGDRIDLAYTFHFSSYMGEEKLGLAVEDINT